MKVLFLTVLYSTPPKECSTIRSLAKLDFSATAIEPSFVFWDNSKEGFGCKDLKTMFAGVDVDYHHSPENLGLAVLYNRVVKQSRHLVDYMVFLDDDSSIPSDYLDSMLTFFESGVMLALPKIYCDDVLISPGVINGVRGRLFDAKAYKAGVVASKNIVGMMSGTVINSKLFDSEIAFCERLSLYGVDTKFYLDYQLVSQDIFFMNVAIGHSSALRDSSIPIDNQIARFSNLMASQLVVFEEKRFFKVRLFTYFIFFVLLKCIRNRSIRYALLFRNLRLFF
ncbi:MAG: glycosyltransferase [Colwellia sp.]